MPAHRSHNTLLAVNAGLHVAGLCATALVAFAGWSAGAILDWRIASNRDEEAAARAFLATSPEVSKRHTQLQAECDALDLDSRELQAKIPDQSQEEEFLAQLTLLAGECQLELGEFRPGLPVTREGFDEFEVQLNGRGSYHGICRFLAGLQHLPRLCKLAQLGLSSADETGESCTIETRLSVPYNLAKTAGMPAGENRP